ncbi:MAG: DUF6364 family protein [Paludibacter sp.]|nr:DUF6364 family protein [Paludibacter sp.]
MDAKLTVKLNKEVIEKAKVYATNHKISLSRIVENYLQFLLSQESAEKDNEEIEISAFVKSMCTGVHIPADIDTKNEYSSYLSKKYK